MCSNGVSLAEVSEPRPPRLVPQQGHCMVPSAKTARRPRLTRRIPPCDHPATFFRAVASENCHATSGSTETNDGPSVSNDRACDGRRNAEPLLVATESTNSADPRPLATGSSASVPSDREKATATRPASRLIFPAWPQSRPIPISMCRLRIKPGKRNSRAYSTSKRAPWKQPFWMDQAWARLGETYVIAPEGPQPFCTFPGLINCRDQN